MDTPTPPAQHTVVEDVLLLLFNSRSESIAGDGVPLFHTLAGAVLVDLAEQKRIEIAERATWRDGRSVRAIGALAPADQLLRDAWTRIAAKPTDVQTLILEIGPTLRQRVLDRLVERGHLRRRRRRLLGLIPYSAVVDGGTARRAQLLAPVRAALLDGADPDPRTATLAALLSASGVLAWLNAEIPWSGDVYARGKAFEHGYWGADAAAEAVRRTTVALIAGQVVTSTAIAAHR